MRRRTLLVRGGAVLGGTLSIAGCTTDALSEAERPPPPLSPSGVADLDLPTSQPLEVAAAGIERAETAEIDSPSALSAVLEEEDLRVSEVTVASTDGESLLSLQYAPPGGSDRGLLSHLGLVAGAYTALVDADHESQTFEATVLDGADSPFGTYEVRRVWAEAYLDGTATTRTYADEITGTVETV